MSKAFIHSERLRRFLRFCVEQTVAGRPENLREYAIAMEVFDRPHSYDPAADPIVRVEARRLRDKLKSYYETDGLQDPLIIEVPKGSYLPSFQLRKQAEPKPRIPWMLVTGVALAIVAAAGWWVTSREPAPPKLTLSRLTSDPGLTMDPVISRDGSLIAYASDRGGRGDLDIWLQQVAGGEPIQLTHDPADDHQPSFSRDRTAIAFRSERDPPGIYTVSALGGDARFIVRDGRDPRFSPDGKWIAYWLGSPGDDFLSPAGKIFMIPRDGGAPRQLCPDFASASFPEWSPDGKRLLFEGNRESTDADWWILTIGDGKAQKTGAFGTLARHGLHVAGRRPSAAWIEDKLVFAGSSGDTTSLWQLPVRGNTPQRLTLGSGLESGPSIASNGTIAFSSLSETVDVWSLRLDTSRGEMASWMERITETAAARCVFPSISADGAKVAYLSNKSRGNAVWVKDVKTGHEAAIARENARYPRISRDGSKVAFTQDQALFVAPSSGGEPERVCPDCGRVWDWSPDGKRILYVAPGSPNAIGELTVPAGSKKTVLKHDQCNLANPQFSPDGGWVAFHTIRSPTQRQIVISRYPPDGAWIPVTDGAGLDRNGVWSPEGNVLYYLSERDGFRCIWAQKLDPASKHPEGSAFPVAHYHSARRSLSGLGDVGAIGLSAAPNKLVFSLGELAGNVWIATVNR